MDRLGNKMMKSSAMESDLGVLVNDKLTISQQSWNTGNTLPKTAPDQCIHVAWRTKGQDDVRSRACRAVPVADEDPHPRVRTLLSKGQQGGHSRQSSDWTHSVLSFPCWALLTSHWQPRPERDYYLQAHLKKEDSVITCSVFLLYIWETVIKNIIFCSFH